MLRGDTVKLNYRVVFIIFSCIFITGLLFYWMNYSKSQISYIKVEEYEYKSVGQPMLKEILVSNEVFRDKDTNAVIMNALRDITKINGTLDIRPNDHLIMVFYDDGKTINYKVWINDREFDHGILEIEGEHYHINEEGTKTLREILN